MALVPSKTKKIRKTKKKSIAMDWRTFCAPVSVKQLSIVFGRPEKFIKRRIAQLTPHVSGGVEKYHIAAAAAYIVKPLADAEEYIGSLRVQDLPSHLKSDFWLGMKDAIVVKSNECEIWRSDAILFVVGKCLSLTKARLVGSYDRIADDLRLPESDRKKLVVCIDALLARMCADLKKLKSCEIVYRPISIEVEGFGGTGQATEDFAELEKAQSGAAKKRISKKVESGDQGGISLEGLQKIFSMDRRTIKNKIGFLEPIGNVRGNDTFDLAAAAAYLVPPKMDIGNCIEDLGFKRVPSAIHTSYQKSRRERAEYERLASHYFAHEEVINIFRSLENICVSNLLEAEAIIIDEMNIDDVKFKKKIKELLEITASKLSARVETFIVEGNEPETMFFEDS